MTEDIAEKEGCVSVCECVHCYLSSLTSYLLSSIYYLGPILKKTPNNTQTLHNTHILTLTRGVKP